MGKALIVLGVLLIVVGTFLAFAGPFLVPVEIKAQIHDYLIIDSTSSPQYDNWAYKQDEDNEYQMVFYFYNMTNSFDVTNNGAIPNYTTAGPYIYRRYRTSINVSFPDGGNEIQFLDFRDYQYDLEASGNRSKTDLIINLSPVSVAALSLTGGEIPMTVAAVGAYLPNFTNYFTGPFISLITSYMVPVYFAAAVDKQVGAINATIGNMTDSLLNFAAYWCNATQPPNSIGNWSGLLLSWNGAPTNISVASALGLLNATKEFSLRDPSAWATWAWDQAMTNATFSALLQAEFQLTYQQLGSIWNWRFGSFAHSIIYPDLIYKYDLDQISDLGWVQYTFGTLLGNQSIVTIFPWVATEYGFYEPTEISYYASGSPNPFPDWQFVKTMMDPEFGLENMLLYQEFLTVYNLNDTGNFSSFGLNVAQAQFIFSYAFTLSYIVQLDLVSEYGPSGGLILTQTVDYWIFNCNMFLANLLQPDPPSCAMLFNHSVYSNSTIYSGKNNINKINQYVAWHGESVVKGVWKEDLSVSGYTELGQFAPGQKTGDTLPTFDDYLVRTILLNYTSPSTVAGIPTHQYVLDFDNAFGISDFYFQSTRGLANMTSYKQSPIFFSLWDMLFVDSSITNKVITQSNATSEFDDSTVIDVEPITGISVQSRKRIQVNLQVPPNCTWCTQNTCFINNLTADTYYPIAKAGEYAVIGPPLSDLLKSKLNIMNKGKSVGLIVGVTLGPVLVVFGLLAVVIGIRKRQRGSYSQINDD